MVAGLHQASLRKPCPRSGPVHGTPPHTLHTLHTLTHTTAIRARASPRHRTRPLTAARWFGVLGRTASTLDVFATLMALAGLPMPSGRVMDSHSLLPVLLASADKAAAAATGRGAMFIYGGADTLPFLGLPLRFHNRPLPFS